MTPMAYELAADMYYGLGVVTSFPYACSSRLHMAPFTNSVGSDVDDKRVDFVGYGDATE